MYLTYRNRTKGISDGVYKVCILGNCGRNELLTGRGSTEGRDFRYALADVVSITCTITTRGAMILVMTGLRNSAL